MVIATGRSQRQVAAMADHIVTKPKDRGLKNVSVEGASQGEWVLIDTGAVIVHLFRPEIRDFYGLENTWSAHPAPTSQVTTGANPRTVSPDGRRTPRHPASVHHSRSAGACETRAGRGDE